jgi:hypothetical protein
MLVLSSYVLFIINWVLCFFILFFSIFILNIRINNFVFYDILILYYIIEYVWLLYSDLI